MGLVDVDLNPRLGVGFTTTGRVDILHELMTRQCEGMHYWLK